MARGTQHRKRRPRPNARAAAVTAPAKQQHRKQRPPQWQEQLFFSRLRNHAKWIYVALAVAFAATFALLGVGSGSTGISSALQNLFTSKGGSGPSISGLQHKLSQHPNDAKSWRAIATAYEQKHRTTDAISALERYTTLRPKDADALQELAGQYSQQSSVYQQEAQLAEAQAQLANPSATFAPPSTTAIGQVYSTDLQDPIGTVLGTEASNRAQSAIQQYNDVISKSEATYKKITKLNPTDASAQVQLGQAAAAASDRQTAIAAYRAFLKLAPSDPEAPLVRQALKQLAPAKKK